MAANWGWARQLRKAVDDRLIGGPHVVPATVWARPALCCSTPSEAAAVERVSFRTALRRAQLLGWERTDADPGWLVSPHQLYIHLVWTTRDRRPMIDSPTRDFLHE